MDGVSGNWQVGGTLVVNEGLSLPAGSLVDSMWSASNALSAAKQEHHLVAVMVQSGTCTTETKMIRVIRGATATLKNFVVSNLTEAAGASTATVDVKKNGTSVLSAVVTLDSDTGNRGVETGTITTTDAVVDDVLEIVISAVPSGTDALPTGVFAQLGLDEDYPS